MPDTPAPARCLTVREVARRWRKRRCVVEQLVRTGLLAAFKIGRSVRITPEAIRTFEQGQPVAKPRKARRRPMVEEYYK